MKSALTKAELAIMDLLWRDKTSLTARQIREQLYPDESKSQHGTVQRLLQRLEEKEAIARDKNLSTHLFSAKLSRKTYAGLQLESIADELTEGSFAPLISHLIEKNKINADEVSRIREMLNAHSDDGDDNT